MPTLRPAPPALVPLGLGGAHRRHLPRGRRPGRQTWRRRGHGAFALAWLVFALLAIAAGLTEGPLGVAVIGAALIPFPYLARPLRGGVLKPRAPRRALGLRIALDGAAPRRGDELAITVRGRRLDGVEAGLVGTCWTDRHGWRLVEAVPLRVHEAGPPVDAAGRARLRVPPELPFSYEGRHLSAAWTVVARRPSGRVATRPIWVTP
jgi:hypothetical protein